MVAAGANACLVTGWAITARWSAERDPRDVCVADVASTADGRTLPDAAFGYTPLSHVTADIARGRRREKKPHRWSSSATRAGRPRAPPVGGAGSRRGWAKSDN
eukprot:5753323-Prymnesium_polylepis.2